MKSVILLLLCLSLTACSNFPLFSDSSWMKNPFSKSPNEDKQQRGQQISSDLDTDQRWYCYADETNIDWRCGHEKTSGEGGTADTSVATSYSSQPSDDIISQPEEPAQSSDTQTGAELNSPDEVAVDPTPIVRWMMGDTEDPNTTETTPAQTSISEVPELAAASPLEASEEPISGTDNADQISSTNAQRVLDVPAGYYAVQLIAFKLQEEILAFAISRGIANPLYVRILSANEQFLYVLLEGIYQNKELADAGADKWVKANPQVDKLWVRAVEDLQSSMREAAANE